MVEPTRVTVDASRVSGPLERVWASFGYDEISWTATPRGRANMAAVREMFGGSAVVRAHNLLTSGNGRGLPHWSSGNIYHEHDGQPVYDWSQADPVFDVWAENGMIPLVELGFCPVQLAGPLPRAFHWSPSLYGEYESWGWSSPPRDEARWAGLIEAVVDHFARRYGQAAVAKWYWELWNEPDISYWQGTVEEYCRLYDVTASAVRRALPGALVGGPATTGNGEEFLGRFLGHCVNGTNTVTGERGTPLDFVSFHTKGAPGFPRTYGVIGPGGAEGDENRSPSTEKMLREVETNLAVIRSYPELDEIPVFVDECDPGVPAHMGIFDNRNYMFCNTEYYAVFQLQLMAALLATQAGGCRGVSLATAWTWYMEGDRYFEGTRSFFTASDIPTPVTNGYRMLSKLGSQRLSCEVGQTADAGRFGTLASRGEDGTVAAIVWHHEDDQYAHPVGEAHLEVRDLPCAGRPVQVREYLIDHQHSNSHTAWRELGAPQAPDAGQVRTILARSSLELLREDKLDSCPSSLSRDMTLRCPAAWLVEIVPA